MSHSSSILNNPIEYLKGVGPQRGDMLRKELGIFTFNNLLNHFPYRHVDKTQVLKISDITPQSEFVQIAGRLSETSLMGEKKGKRLIAYLEDETGDVELVWFQGINWVQKMLREGERYLVYGRVSFFMGRPQITHPEIELIDTTEAKGKNFLEPVYPTTEKLKARGLSGRAIGKLSIKLFELISEKDIPEILPSSILEKYRLLNRYQSYRHIHFPENNELYQQAVRRLKFEELFLSQLRLGMLRSERHHFSRGVIFEKVGDTFNEFYNHHLPFELTNAQKRVLKEIRKDTGSGRQMNRLLQGDVGSGKTIVALLAMLLAIGNGYQCCMMAPTEILAQQHYQSIGELIKSLPVNIKLLTGSSKSAERKKTLAQLAEGGISILIGTHALIEDEVKFKNLGLAIIDEQHRFGVEQRSKLWKKNEVLPHVLVMTATPIPRTLAMTAYGDLDYSVMDEMPPGRKPVKTVHRFDRNRPQVMDFIKEEIAKGRQAYIIFPLIEESEKLNYENLMKGYEEVKAFFPEPKYWISMVHGKQTQQVKDENMRRFVTGDTQIMVSTTVIEVGVNVPNASVMVIESAEKFGLSQLHQLRGRVGRGSEQSFCILLTGSKITNDARERLKIMEATNNGFEIAEKDLELRGPGEIEGTRQSGVLNFKLASVVADKPILEAARNEVERLLDDDPEISSAENLLLKSYLLSQKGKTVWSKIS
ncbi:MAG: ATP-dependent DNA helicase RecG [Sphingobacteriales bacterium]|nr:ATP-dependent DNA helicase RecG [Sphingobacteriales bacterium]MBI3717616.1 ATP-dependent DNA helicase RecG [Sphingobacteriales bacterium]